MATEQAPRVGEHEVELCLADAGEALARVRLRQELQRPRRGPAFTWDAGSSTWRLRFPRLGVDRMEYLLEVEDRAGNVAVRPDANNPLRAAGPFGDKSVIEFPGYRPPAWFVPGAPLAGDVREVWVRSRFLAAHLDGVLWSAPGLESGSEAPLLVVHDGPEYAAFSGLLQLLEHSVSSAALPPFRAALLGPVERDETYSASARYGRALVDEILPILNQLAPTPPERRFWVGMGASLGALAMLHGQRLRPESFGGLFLQSGSFFRQRFDRSERGFPRFRRISRFVGTVLAGLDGAARIPVTMTCGVAEENLANNRALASALRAQGYAVRLHEVRDAHNWVAWRDALSPGLVDLLRLVWVP
jgi:enterochelin esterase family protein